MKYLLILLLLGAGSNKHPHKAKTMAEAIHVFDSIKQANEVKIWLDSFDRAEDSSLWARANLSKGVHVTCEQFNEKGLPVKLSGVVISCEDKGINWGSHHLDNLGSWPGYVRYELYCSVKIDSFKTLTKEFPVCNCYKSP